MEHKDDGAEVVDLDVFYGERYDFQVGLANVGTIAVGELELRDVFSTPFRVSICVEYSDKCGISSQFASQS